MACLQVGQACYTKQWTLIGLKNLFRIDGRHGIALEAKVNQKGYAIPKRIARCKHVNACQETLFFVRLLILSAYYAIIDAFFGISKQKGETK